MNQKNGKNSLGLDICFGELDNPVELFKKWFSEAKKTEISCGICFCKSNWSTSCWSL